MIARLAQVFRRATFALLLMASGCAAPGVEVARGTDGAWPASRAELAATVGTLVHGFHGRVGLAIQSVEGGWTVSYDGRTPYPQQSVSKLCTAIAVLEAVDRGRIHLSDPVLVHRADMSVFHQPIQAHLTDAGYPTTIDGLLVGAITESDNAADDILIRHVGGAAAVQRAVASRGFDDIRCGPEEHLLESKIAGLAWRPEYSFGQAFWTARDALDPKLRADKLNAYVADPDDGASPLALVRLLTMLKRGQLLSEASTRHLLDIMASTKTGPLRLPAGLAAGWSIAHKTGTGQDLGDLATGNNDVGLLIAPDGRAYAVAVMIGSTRRPVPDRQRLMADVARAVVAAHQHGAQ